MIAMQEPGLSGLDLDWKLEEKAEHRSSGEKRKETKEVVLVSILDLTSHYVKDYFCFYVATLYTFGYI